jgi:hypothetical protein
MLIWVCGTKKKIDAHANAKRLKKLPKFGAWNFQLTGDGRGGGEGRKIILGVTVKLKCVSEGVHCTP